MTSPKITPSMENGKAAIARGLVNGLGFGSTEFHVLSPRTGVTPEWLFYFVRQEQFRAQARASFTGTAGQLRVPASFMARARIPLAPLPDQQRIVAAIETHFTRLDAAVAALQRVQANLRRYRAAVLKAACAGRLVPSEAALARQAGRTYEPAEVLLARILAERRARWEAEHPGKRYVEPAGLRRTELPALPEGWVWATVKQAGRVQLGRQRAPQYHEGPFMRPYLRVANVFEDRIDTSSVMWMNFDPEEYVKYKLQYGDILLNEGQSPELLGRPAMYRNEVPGACFQNTLIRFQAESHVLPQFALCLFRTYMHSGRFQKISQITTNIAHLSAGRFADLEFPLPPLAEQQRIVAEVERRLSVVAEVEAAVATNLQRASRLRQAILKQAFAGRLGC